MGKYWECIKRMCTSGKYITCTVEWVYIYICVCVYTYIYIHTYMYSTYVCICTHEKSSLLLPLLPIIIVIYTHYLLFCPIDLSTFLHLSPVLHLSPLPIYRNSTFSFSSPSLPFPRSSQTREKIKNRSHISSLKFLDKHVESAVFSGDFQLL